MSELDDQAFTALLIRGDRQEALRWALRLYDRKGARYLYEHVLTPALHEIGDRWFRGDVGVADEHIASAIVQSILAALAPQFPWVKGGPRALVGCVQGERHDVGARMMSDLLALDGWDERFLGADLPTEQFVQKAQQFAPRLIAVSITLSDGRPALQSLVEALHREAPDAKVIVGGRGTAHLDAEGDIRIDAVANTCSEGVALVAPWKENGDRAPIEQPSTFAAQMVPRDETLIVAHDLRQPLNVIQLATGYLLQHRYQALDAQEQSMLNRIRAAAARLNAMIDDLTSASLIESGRMKVMPRAVDVGELVASVVNDLGESIGGHTVRRISSEKTLAWIDPDRIHRVLENLLSNAAKYARPGTEVSVETRPACDFVEVIVTNQGRGIPPDQLGSVFDKFTRTRDARDSSQPGLGLGLYIAKRLVEAHEGRIWAESVPGKSVSFHFTLPRSASCHERKSRGGTANG